MSSMGVRHLEFVYGFHGCDKSVAKAVLEMKSVMLSSDNDYDWLGRCPFLEGEPVFPASKLYDKSHIQIAVRNPCALVELFPVDLRELD